MKVCNVPGCPTLHDGPGGRCPQHRRDADKARGTATQRGYTSQGHARFRTAVLTRDPICVLCGAEVSTVADHYPHSRRDLIHLGLNPNDPQYGRGLGKRCHDRETATNQPGGWNTPP